MTIQPLRARIEMPRHSTLAWHGIKEFVRRAGYMSVLIFSNRVAIIRGLTSPARRKSTPFVRRSDDAKIRCDTPCMAKLAQHIRFRIRNSTGDVLLFESPSIRDVSKHSSGI